MIEFLRHATGLCGEGHPNLLLGGGALVVAYRYCWCWLKVKFNRNHVCDHGKDTEV
jgi:hypothetical protein